MNSASYRPVAGREHISPHRRITSFALAIAIEILLILAFITLNSPPKPKPEFKGGTLSIFDLASDDESNAQPTEKKSAQATKSPPRPVPPRPRPPVPDLPLPYLIVSKEVYAASDIAKLGSNAPGARVAEGTGGGNSAPGDSQRVGTGPNGEPLYAAEWYREPTRQELSFYLPKRMPEGGGWGLVACRTVDRYHVDDCVELGSSPPGSRLASAVRQAAWQFLVRPPRVGGRPMVGEWVRIRIDYDVGGGEQ